VPALTIVPKPERRFADKVIRLASIASRPTTRGFDAGAQRVPEIGERLKKDSTCLEHPAPNSRWNQSRKTWQTERESPQPPDKPTLDEALRRCGRPAVEPAV